MLKSLWNTAKLNRDRVSNGMQLLHRKPLDNTTSTSSVQIFTPGSAVGDSSGKPPRLDWAPIPKFPVEIRLSADGSLRNPGESTFPRTHRKSISSHSPVSAHDFRAISSEALGSRVSNSEDGNRPVFQNLERTESSDKRKSWWSHRKTSSDGGVEILKADEVSEEKNEIFKSFFAIPQTERLIQSNIFEEY